MAEDLHGYLRPDGETVTVGGASVLAIVDVASDITLSDAVVTETSLLVVSADVASLTDGAAATVRSQAYKVRRRLKEPPDGVFTRVILAKS